MTTTNDMKREALERAELISDVPRGPGYHGRLWSSIAAALLRARAEGIDWAAEQVDSDLVFGTLDELRAAADELEGSDA